MSGIRATSNVGCETYKCMEYVLVKNLRRRIQEIMS